MENNNPELKPTSVRLTPELKKNLDIIAKAEKRSFNNLVNLILSEYVESHLKDHAKN